MRTTYRVLAYLLVAQVVVQAMAIAIGIAGLGHWVDDGNTFNKAVMEADEFAFPEARGFMIHFLNGMLMALVTILLLIVSLFTKVAGATKRAAILLGLLVLQIFLGIYSHTLSASILLHALNAFVIFSVAVWAAHRMPKGASPEVPAATTV